jgi:hypothetical protein
MRRRRQRDSLCLLITSIIWSSLLSWFRNTQNNRSLLIAGLCLGLGLLTKLVFAAVLAGTAAWVVVVSIRSTELRDFRSRILPVLLLAIPAAAISSWWYVLQHLSYDQGATGLNIITLGRLPHFTASLGENFQLQKLPRAILVLGATMSWFAPYVYIGASLHRPVFFLMLWMWIAYSVEICKRRRGEDMLGWLPAFLLLLFLAALVLENAMYLSFLRRLRRWLVYTCACPGLSPHRELRPNQHRERSQEAYHVSRHAGVRLRVPRRRHLGPDHILCGLRHARRPRPLRIPQRLRLLPCRSLIILRSPRGPIWHSHQPGAGFYAPVRNLRCAKNSCFDSGGAEQDRGERRDICRPTARPR